MGIETGGTTCKVGIVTNVKTNKKIERFEIIDTTYPDETVQKICAYINE